MILLLISFSYCIYFCIISTAISFNIDIVPMHGESDLVESFMFGQGQFKTIVSMFIWFCYLEWVIYGGKLIWCDLLTSKIYQVEGIVLVSVRIFANKVNTWFVCHSAIQFSFKIKTWKLMSIFYFRYIYHKKYESAKSKNWAILQDSKCRYNVYLPEKLEKASKLSYPPLLFVI